MKIKIRNIIIKIQNSLGRFNFYLDSLILDYFNDCKHDSENLSCRFCVEVF